MTQPPDLFAMPETSLLAACLLIRECGAELVVDVTADLNAWVAWWSIGTEVLGVTPVPPGHLPPGVIGLEGDHRDPNTLRRVTDQVAGRPVDVLVTYEAPPANAIRGVDYRPILRPGGLLLVRQEDVSGVTYGVVKGAAEHG
jgi:hypothetical protein